ncbi:Aspartic proteinase-like protein [Actinidia chinensis var. chinensis]|uniref:Aspartic proteinase-like protein n=1 Tax=Actinidia chinensis var. chinensis TaxID=1590841 RepID=A0A2R6PWQ4_ACTCC|nr:Aspartic proteinase-like protein [Actinidia chinensis var. chinensis]
MDLRSVFVLGLLLVCCTPNLFASANVVFKVKHKFGAGERNLAALKAHDDRRHGRSLAAVDLPLGGNGSPTDTALYYTKIGIGTPSKDYYMQVDTGSDIMWVNCAGCDKCPTKSNLGVELSLYDPKGSTTGTLLTCDQDFCIETFNPRSCKVGAVCAYGVTYGDGSSSVGYFVKDNILLDRASGNLQTTPMNGSIAFGCGARQSGQLDSSTQALDGILGFGQANSSMISQLALDGKVSKMFAHCLDGTNGGGIFAIGQLVQPKLKSTPLVPNQAHYNIILKSVKMGRDDLQLPSDIFDADTGTSMVIDSGTTLAYLADELYNPLITKVLAAQPDLKLHTVDQQFKCFQFTKNVDDGFPAITFGFENSLSLTVYPREYLFQIRDDVWCIGWQSSGISKDGKELNLLGDMVLSSKLFLYDLENQTIGWTEYNCSSSVKVKDVQTGAEYLIEAHDLSSACSLKTGLLTLTLLLVLAFLHIHI